MGGLSKIQVMVSGVTRSPSRDVVSWVIGGLGAWWVVSPLLFSLGFALDGRHPGDWLVVTVFWAALGGAGLAPFAGLVVALVARRRWPLAYFALMCAVTVSGVAFLLYALAHA
ncbi:hypothetical protein J4573_15495 [Actinomadura barringtoniae]|uniref:Uncharacterized protein n=1 Tax=Actinomadura barringtoniae TaxID=1427535 RepID=A0A939T1Y3_9ACTN|nr:hypothetical protein [Actinomadura barringtoniae]MBO2448506.1 hypothetical protein [Actinomadura barringtoniae]